MSETPFSNVNKQSMVPEDQKKYDYTMMKPVFFSPNKCWENVRFIIA